MHSATLGLTVAMLTYQRESQLPEAIAAVRAELDSFHRSEGPAVSARLLVVDNDPNGRARRVVADAGWSELIYAHEAEHGISAGRNRAIDESAGSRLLVFIDDDELPVSGWLSAIYRCWREHEEPGGVAGPVRSTLPAEVDPWVVTSRFYDRVDAAARRTGQALPRCATNNLLLDLDAVRAAGVRFDPAFGLTGGGDSLFTESFTRSGARLIWCREAEVTEPVPAERATREYVLRRTYSLSNVSTRVQISLDSTSRIRSVLIRAREAVKALTRITLGALSSGTALLTRNPVSRVRGRIAIQRGLGALTACAGVRYSEYSRKRSS